MPLGEVRAAARQGADGVSLSWHLTEPEPLLAGGAIPFFIDWGESPHPAVSAVAGAFLADFRVEHPDVAEVQRMLAVLDLDVQVTWARLPAIVALIEGRHGAFELR